MRSLKLIKYLNILAKEINIRNSTKFLFTDVIPCNYIHYIHYIIFGKVDVRIMHLKDHSCLNCFQLGLGAKAVSGFTSIMRNLS